MNTKIIEAHQGESVLQNHGKFLLGRFDIEWARRCALPDVDWVDGPDTLLSKMCGWSYKHLWVLDLQTGEGACFLPGGSAKADLEKHAIWVCPMYEPFLEWLYAQDLNDIRALPDVVALPDAPFAVAGRRRAGPEPKVTTEAARQLLRDGLTAEAYAEVAAAGDTSFEETRCWQDLERTIPAVNDGDPVAVMESGNTVLTQPDPDKRPRSERGTS